MNEDATAKPIDLMLWLVQHVTQPTTPDDTPSIFLDPSAEGDYLPLIEGRVTRRDEQ